MGDMLESILRPLQENKDETQSQAVAMNNNHSSRSSSLSSHSSGPSTPSALRTRKRKPLLTLSMSAEIIQSQLINGNYCSLTCDNSIVRSFSTLSSNEYCIHNLCSGTAELKSCLWRHFVDTVVRCR